jgi:hypothetical protein
VGVQVIVGAVARDGGERGWVLYLLVLLMGLVLLGDWVFVDVGFGGGWEERGVGSGGGALWSLGLRLGCGHSSGRRGMEACWSRRHAIRLFAYFSSEASRIQCLREP